MSKTTMFENEHAVIFFHEADKIIHHQIKEFIHGEKLRKVLENRNWPRVARSASLATSG